MPGNLASLARRLLSLLLLPAMIACHQDEVPIEPGVSLNLARQRAAQISDVHYDLRFDIPAATDADIDARVTIGFELAQSGSSLQLDFRAPPDAVTSVQVNGVVTPCGFEREHIVVPGDALVAGRNAIDIDFTAGSSSLNRRPDYLYTLFVPDRARTAFPLFDQPDLKATFELTLGIPQDWSALANTPVAAVTRTDGRSEYRFARSHPISSYLFAFVAGRFDTITRKRGDRTMTLFHRETDTEKVARNLDAIFDLHATALAWLEDYTDIDYPFQKFDFALIPDFQYGGMEHPGAILYRASHLFLEETPTQNQLLRRAGLIAHETAHMWFGNLVTMKWFDDVWTKEVFANFMAAKIVNPAFPGTDHDLDFLVSHHPRAYSVDRTAGTHPIRQTLDNLNGAGQLYGPIIYAKAPVVMRQLESILGEQELRGGLRDYLRTHAFANASWPELIRILDGRTDADLAAWSRVWVTGEGRPEFLVQLRAGQPRAGEPQAGQPGAGDGPVLVQRDPDGLDRVWPQRFRVRQLAEGILPVLQIDSRATVTPLDVPATGADTLLFNADGMGYGLFPAQLKSLQSWDLLTPVERGSALINLYEQLLAGNLYEVEVYFAALLAIVETSENQLLLDLAIGQLARIYHSLLAADIQAQHRNRMERALWRRLLAESDRGRARLFFEGYTRLASSPEAIARLHDLWSGKLALDQLQLAEEDRIALAQTLAIQLPDSATGIIAAQLAHTANPDSRRRLSFVAPSVAAEERVRDAFFASLADPANRETEVWVIEALRNLHHPQRVAQSRAYIERSLALLPELQATGDIFFPTAWLHATLENHYADAAVATVRTFLETHPDLDPQLRMKILQAADMAFRANGIRARQAVSPGPVPDAG